jgi:DNA polymerase V
VVSVIDKMNKSYGTNKIKFGNQSPGRQWKMKQEKLSKSYTTRLNEIITINL